MKLDLQSSTNKLAFMKDNWPSFGQIESIDQLSETELRCTLCLLDVVLLRPVPRLKLPGLLGSYKKGEHLSEGDTVTEKFAPYMTFFRTGSIDIEVLDGNPLITTLDGECSPQLRMHAEIAHSAARILLPPELAANANKTPVLQAMGE